jgi:hypothetical protein
MKKPTRKQVLAWISYHASQGDLGAAQRLYIEHSISWDAYKAAISLHNAIVVTPATLEPESKNDVVTGWE